MSVLSTEAVPAPTTAVAAFLRGVGRRAIVFAELQGADSANADLAIAAAVRVFRNAAPALDLPRWPQAFWSALVNAPALRGARPDAPVWAQIPAAPRAALLLRLAAGLNEAEAARVLGVGEPVYRLALKRALAAAQDDVAALQAHLQQRIATVPATRVERLASANAVHSPAAGRPGSSRPRLLLALLWSLLLLCVAAFALTFWWPPGPDAADDAQAGPREVPLPATPPASRFSKEAARLVHPDFALLVDVEAAPFLDELEFYSWLAAQDAGAGALQPAGALAPDAAMEPLYAPGSETDDAQL